MIEEVQRAIAARPRDRWLVWLTDYDGTLADFHPDPATAYMSARTAALVRRLAERTDLSFGVVSGRRVADLRQRTGLPASAYVAGLHGMEIDVRGRRWEHPALNGARERLGELREQLTHLAARVPGMLIEDKEASIAVHVRACATPADRSRGLACADQCAAPLVAAGRVRRLPGSMAVEFLPRAACDKGDAVRWIAADVEATAHPRPWVVFVGDDLTDEDAFSAIDDGVGVVVGDRMSAAHHQLRSREEVDELLEWLLRGG
jgi:trehalose 6-phosphate phosphatase